MSVLIHLTRELMVVKVREQGQTNTKASEASHTSARNSLHSGG